MKMLKNLLRDIHGSPAVEFAIVASVISLAALGAFQALGQQSSNQMGNVENAYEEANR
jgi:Flp pilus assembly pilin Flp